MSYSKLQGKWVLEAIDGAAVGSDVDIYFQITGEKISGYDGCNKFGGLLGEKPRIRAGRRGCAHKGPRLPLELSNPLPQLSAAKLDGDRLVLPLPNGQGEAQFFKKSQP